MGSYHNHRLQSETLQEQYELVKSMTASENSAYGSHVMQYGNANLSNDKLNLYIGTNPANDNRTYVNENIVRLKTTTVGLAT